MSLGKGTIQDWGIVLPVKRVPAFLAYYTLDVPCQVRIGAQHRGRRFTLSKRGEEKQPVPVASSCIRRVLLLIFLV